MRYYDITAGPLHYTSLGSDGLADPGALLVELDITLKAADKPEGAWVRIWGIGLDAISQAQQLWQQPITVNGGMSAGLPLAHPEQAGCLGSGAIYQAFGNWVGVNQTLDLIFTSSTTNVQTQASGPNPPPAPHNIVLNWRKGQPLSDALQQAIQQGIPDLQVDMKIGSYTAPSDQIHYAQSLQQLAVWLRGFTQDSQFSSPGQQGVSLVPHNGTIYCMDGSQPEQAPTINYEDMIGQPTWIDVNKLQVKLVMRGDLKVGQSLTIPPTLVTNTASNANLAQGGSPLTFSGSISITKIQHLGNSRSPEAESWATIVEGNTTTGT